MIFLANLEADAGRYDDARSNLATAVEYLRESPERAQFVRALLQFADMLRRRSEVDAASSALDEAEVECSVDGRASRELRPAVRLRLLLEICQVAKEMPTPDKPRIRRASAEAITLARQLKLVELEQAARTFADYAG